MYLCLICNVEKPKELTICTGKLAYIRCKPCSTSILALKKKEWVRANKHKQQEYYQKNKETLIIKNNIRKNKYRVENREDYLAQSHDYYIRNKEDVLRKNKIYRDNNKGAKNALTAKRRALKKNATPKWLSKFDMQYIRHLYIQARALTDLTGEVHEVDHIIPLQSDLVCGLHCPLNLQILTKTHNRKKDNHLLPEDSCPQ